MSDRYDRIATLIAEEARSAAGKHKPMHSHHEAKSVIEEELDEYWDLVKLNPRKPMLHPTKGHSMTVEQWKAEMVQELIQTAAMCLRTLHDLTVSGYAVPLVRTEDPRTLSMARALTMGDCTNHRAVDNTCLCPDCDRPAFDSQARNDTWLANFRFRQGRQHTDNCKDCAERAKQAEPVSTFKPPLPITDLIHRAGDISLAGGVPQRLNGVSFNCGCTRYLDGNNIEHTTRCADGQCTRLGRR